MEGTIYQADYDEEHQQTTVDNLNLLYVAFTRASRNLFVLGKRSAKVSRSVLIEQTLPLLPPLPDLQGAVLTGADDENQSLCFTFGALALPRQRSNDDSAEPNVFTAQPEPIRLNIETFEQKVVFRQSNKSRSFAEAPDDEQQQQEGYIHLGNVLHNVFSSIRTSDDIDNALRQLEYEGILYDEHITRPKLESMIRKRLADPRVADWFSHRWTLYNECSIIGVDSQTGQVFERRPDRVMTDGNATLVVDFKFGRPRDDYRQQVQQYMQLLCDMGHTNVKGYLWYVYTGEVEEV
jgi:ATP-dependent exoDNAse (exonuclease V) beta subunit